MSAKCAAPFSQGYNTQQGNKEKQHEQKWKEHLIVLELLGVEPEVP